MPRPPRIIFAAPGTRAAINCAHARQFVRRPDTFGKVESRAVLSLANAEKDDGESANSGRHYHTIESSLFDITVLSKLIHCTLL